MRNASTFLGGSALVLGFCLGVAGCDRPPAEAPAAASVSVPVSYPVERYVTDYAEFTARIAAVDSVDVKAQVWGYLDKVNFKEGDLVKKGDVLFELDPRRYQAKLNQAKGMLARDEAMLANDEAEYQRNLSLYRTAAVSVSELQKSAAARGVDRANIQVDKATIASSELDLQFTKVVAPVSGRVSRALVTVGNLIQGGDQGNATQLTTIVSVDPMYAYFDMDEPTVLRIADLIRQGKFGPAEEEVAKIPVRLQLANEKGFPHEATLDFVNNQLDKATATLLVRAVVPNPKPANGPRVFYPNMFARVRVPTSPPGQALLVNAGAVGTDQDLKYLYVVDEDNKVVRRAVKLGSLQDGLWVVAEGLKPGEHVIVNGLQRVQPGATVNPRLVPMPMPTQGSLPPLALKTPAPTPNK